MNEISRGWIHSFESGGMVDGPGLRFVAFLQGCPLRCLYCHNPDSWIPGRGKQMSAAEVVTEARKYKAWMDSSGGGITLSGGEPLNQSEFVLEIFRRAGLAGIHRALDTSGYATLAKAAPAFDASDLVMMDIKTANEDLHKKVCGVPIRTPLASLDYLVSSGKPLWIRHVVVPGLTDKDEDLEKLADLVSGLDNLQRFEFLPFHKMGEEKWQQEGADYSLGATPTPSPEFMDDINREFIRRGIPVHTDGGSSRYSVLNSAAG